MLNLLTLNILNPFIIYWDNLCDKLEPFYYKRGNYCKVGKVLLQIGEICVFTKWGKNYCKVGQELLQSGADIRKWDNFIKKWVTYYKLGELL